MIADNFKYDGKLASDFGLMICNIGGGGGDETISAGSDINFNQTPIRHGGLFLNTDTTYDSPMEATFQVCKFDCSDSSIQVLSLDEKRKIARWLQRKEPHMLELINNDNEDTSRYVFEGMFNLSEIYNCGDCIGYELRFTSNRPYAISKTITKTIIATTPDFEYKFNDTSDEVGYLYPRKMTIIPAESGDISIRNYIENPEGRLTQIRNCIAGETITFTDMLTISTDNPSHNKTLQDDFNFCFFRIANSYTNRTNRIIVSSPCTIKIEYNPIVKGVGL